MARTLSIERSVSLSISALTSQASVHCARRLRLQYTDARQLHSASCRKVILPRKWAYFLQRRKQGYGQPMTSCKGLRSFWKPSTWKRRGASRSESVTNGGETCRFGNCGTITPYLPRHGQELAMQNKSTEKTHPRNAVRNGQPRGEGGDKHRHGSDWLVVRGARTHNLKNITVAMPRGAMTVITGLSGSGKSSLAFDTIFAEGQRRYVESLSAYARQFLNQMAKPDVDEISGLSPAISIDQKSRSNNPRSTVATVTEIYDYLRVLYARAGQPYCIHHDVPIVRLSKEEMIKMVLQRVEDRRQATDDSKIMGVAVDKSAVTIYAPVVVGRKGEYYQMLYDLLSKGFEKVVVDGKVPSLREKIVLDRNKRHDVDAVVDSIFVSEFARGTTGARERLHRAA